MRVLVVEDHADSAKLYSRLLSREGHTVDVAYDIESALALCERNAYGVLLADICLPDGSGLELIKALFCRCPVRGIAISGYGFDADIQKSLEAGFAEHLTKPVEAHHLFAAIERVAALPLPSGPAPAPSAPRIAAR